MRRISGIGFEFVWNYSDFIVNWIWHSSWGCWYYLVLDLFGTWNPLWNKDKVYVRSSSVRLSFVTVFDFGPQHTVSHSIVKVIKEKSRALYHEHINNIYDHFVSQVPNNIYHFSLIIGCSKHYQWTFQLYNKQPVSKEGH